jgi:nucleotide-binding universal stress UspA family protein
MFTHLLVAGDGSSPSLHAARTAGDLARATKAAHVCIAVFQHPVPSYLGAPQFDKVATSRVMEAEAVAKAMREEAGALPCDLDIEIVMAPPAEGIPTLCETHQADLVILGAGSFGPFTHLLLSEPVPRPGWPTPCPVLIVR